MSGISNKIIGKSDQKQWYDKCITTTDPHKVEHKPWGSSDKLYKPTVDISNTLTIMKSLIKIQNVI